MPRRLAVLLVVATACSVPQARTVVPGSTEAATPAPRDGIGAMAGGVGAEAAQEQGGVSLVPLTSRPLFVFGPAVPVAYVQESSYALVDVVPSHKRLKVQPLPSPTGTAAINLIEEAGKGEKWGEVMTPAQRLVFGTFAADPLLGEWLVLVNDVMVTAGPDPIPLTAYRWPREVVEEYAACGIPAPGTGVPWTKIDDCSLQFYRGAEVKLVAQVRLGQQGPEGSGQVGR